MAPRNGADGAGAAASLPSRWLSKKAVAIIAVALTVLAVAGPVYFAIRLAHAQALDAEREHVAAIAQDALRRSVAIADQTDTGIKKLRALVGPHGDPCSDKALALMQALDLSSKYVQAFGTVSGNTALCSSLGGRHLNLDLGPADSTSPDGVRVRNHVTFNFDPDKTVYVVIEQDGFATIVNRDLAIDVTLSETGVALAVFTYPSGKTNTSRGDIPGVWITKALSLLPQQLTSPMHRKATFTDGGRIVSVQTSSKHFVGAVAAVPTSHADAQARKAALALAPLGALGGLLLAAAVLYLARLQLAMPAVLRTALRRGEFFLVYQPVVDMRTGQWIGAEALVRWRRPDGELVRPDLFIPVIEDSGLGPRFTAHILALAAQDLTVLAAERPDFHVAFNLTPADLHSQATVLLFRDFIKQTGMRPESLVVEATERGFLDTAIAGNMVRQLLDLGVRVLIDDFGTGYSSLSYLESLEVNGLKIDKAFVDTLGTGAATSHVVSHIIEMAKALQLDMVAEGVERQSQADALLQQGVTHAQGWLYSAGIPFTDLLFGLHLHQDETVPPSSAPSAWGNAWTDR